MPFDEFLAERVRRAFRGKHVEFEEKRMMGGMCFLVDGKMCAGVEKNRLMARIGPHAQEQALRRKGCHEMDFTGRPMNGFVFVEAEGMDSDAELDDWIGLCLAFNPEAKSAKKKHKKG